MSLHKATRRLTLQTAQEQAPPQTFPRLFSTPISINSRHHHPIAQLSERIRMGGKYNIGLQLTWCRVISFIVLLCSFPDFNRRRRLKHHTSIIPSPKQEQFKDKRTIGTLSCRVRAVVVNTRANCIVGGRRAEDALMRGLRAAMDVRRT
jgi:hypothetical protein